jgi:hypothetical protein
MVGSAVDMNLMTPTLWLQGLGCAAAWHHENHNKLAAPKREFGTGPNTELCFLVVGDGRTACGNCMMPVR